MDSVAAKYFFHSEGLICCLDNNNIKAKEGDYYYALDNGKWVKAETKGKSINPPTGVTNLLPSRGRLYYGKTDPAYIRAKEAAEAEAKAAEEAEAEAKAAEEAAEEAEEEPVEEKK